MCGSKSHGCLFGRHGGSQKENPSRNDQSVNNDPNERRGAFIPVSELVEVDPNAPNCLSGDHRPDQRSSSQRYAGRNEQCRTENAEKKTNHYLGIDDELCCQVTGGSVFQHARWCLGTDGELKEHGRDEQEHV